MAVFDRLFDLFKPAVLKEADTCASGYPDWKPSETWTPKFDDNGAEPEAYDGD